MRVDLTEMRSKTLVTSHIWSRQGAPGDVDGADASRALREICFGSPGEAPHRSSISLSELGALSPPPPSPRAPSADHASESPTCGGGTRRVGEPVVGEAWAKRLGYAAAAWHEYAVGHALPCAPGRVRNPGPSSRATRACHATRLPYMAGTIRSSRSGPTSQRPPPARERWPPSDGRHRPAAAAAARTAGATRVRGVAACHAPPPQARFPRLSPRRSAGPPRAAPPRRACHLSRSS